MPPPRAKRPLPAKPIPPPNKQQTPQPLDHLTITLAVLVSLAAGSLYFASCARDIVVGDTPEYVTAALTLGVPHPSGYPLLIMLGHFFSLLLAGPLPFRVNLLSAAASAVTIGVVFLTAFRLTRHHAASAAGALILAVSPLFWQWSLVAEVFPLNSLLAAILIYLLVLWNDEPRRTGFLIAAAFVAGLSATNQLTIVLLAPAILLLLLRHRGVLFARPRVIALSVAAIVAGLLPYLYLPWAASRHPQPNWGEISTLQDFLAHFLRKSYGTGRLVSSAGLIGGSPIERVFALCASFGWLMGLLASAGAIAAFRKRRWYFWFTALAFAFAGVAFAAYANINVESATSLAVLQRFFLLSQVAAAPLIAMGILQAAGAFSTALPKFAAHAANALSIAALVIAVTTAALNYPAITESNNHLASRLGQDILASLDPNAILLAGGDEVLLPLLYVQTIEHYRPDVTLIMMPLLPGEWYVRQLRQRFPGLVIPFNRYGEQSATMKALIDANRGRPIAVIGNLLDNTPEGSYWFYRRGLVSIVEPMDADIKMSRMLADNERQLAHYRPPSPDAIKPRSFERGVLTLYAAPALSVAQELEKVRRFAEARSWYQRALAQDPNLTAAREALARIANN